MGLDGAGRGGTWRQMAEGVELHREAIGFLWCNRSLWSVAAVPAILSALCLSAVGFGLFYYGGDLYTWTVEWLPALEAGAWYSWLWIAPGKFLVFALGLLAFLALLALCFLGGFLVANVLASPFHDLLSERVERIAAGTCEGDSPEGLWANVKEVGRIVKEELKRTAVFLLIQLLIFAVGLFPGGQLFALPCSIAVAAKFLALDMASYSLDRRRMSFAAKRRWLSENRARVSGFGGLAFVVCLVPGLNWLAMPWFVTGGTLLVMRSEDRGDAMVEGGTTPAVPTA